MVLELNYDSKLVVSVDVLNNILYRISIKIREGGNRYAN